MSGILESQTIRLEGAAVELRTADGSTCQSRKTGTVYLDSVKNLQQLCKTLQSRPSLVKKSVLTSTIEFRTGSTIDHGMVAKIIEYRSC